MAFEVKIDPPVLRVDQSGEVRVGPTRMIFALVLHAYLQGNRPEEINEMYPVVSLANLYSAIAYYHHHKADCEAFLKEWDDSSEKFGREYEERHGAELNAMREKMARRKAERLAAGTANWLITPQA